MNCGIPALAAVHCFMAFSAKTLAGSAAAAPGGEDDTNVDSLSSGSIRYLSLDDVYSATSPASGSSILMSKKIKARKLESCSEDPKNPIGCESSCIDEGKSRRRRSKDNAPLLHVYSRRCKRPRLDDATQSGSFFDLLLSRAKLAAARPAKVEPIEEYETDGGDINGVSENEELVKKKKKRKSFSGELSKLGVDSSVFLGMDGPRLREHRNHINSQNSQQRKPMRKKKSADLQITDERLRNKKRWVRLVKLDV